MERAKLKIDNETARGLANGDYDDTIYEVVSDKIKSKSRWSYNSELIIKTLADGRFWRSFYSRGATESQDESPYEYGEPNFTEVFPKLVSVVIYT